MRPSGNAAGGFYCVMFTRPPATFRPVLRCEGDPDCALTRESELKGNVSMRLQLLGAAAAAALAIGCTDRADTDTATTTTAADTTSTTTTDTYNTASNTPSTTYPSTADTTTTPPDSTTDTTTDMGDTSTEPLDTATAPGASTTDASTPNLGSLQPTPVLVITEIRSKSDAERVASGAFSKADADGNGELSRTEYATMAQNIASAQSTGSASSGMSGSAGSSSSFDQTAADSAFQEAAGGEDVMTMDQFEQAMIKRFDEADADKNDQLNSQEQQTFATLITGSEMNSPQ
jgi:hypothetical protein